jgi:hypothetical protein
MPDVSAALIVLAGAVMIIAGSMPSAITNDSRARIAGIGMLIFGVGLLAWLISFFVTMNRIVK